MLNREKHSHQESTSSQLPIQTPGQGIKQPELDLAWKERRLELKREHNLPGKRWPQPPGLLATGRKDGTRGSSPLGAREHRPDVGANLGSGNSRRWARSSQRLFTKASEEIQSLTWDLRQERLSFTEAEAGRGSREKEKEVASTSPAARRGEGGSDV